MLYAVMGHEDFQRGLKYYMEKYKVRECVNCVWKRMTWEWRLNECKRERELFDSPSSLFLIFESILVGWMSSTTTPSPMICGPHGRNHPANPLAISLALGPNRSLLFSFSFFLSQFLFPSLSLSLSHYPFFKKSFLRWDTHLWLFLSLNQMTPNLRWIFLLSFFFFSFSLPFPFLKLHFFVSFFLLLPVKPFPTLVPSRWFIWWGKGRK